MLSFFRISNAIIWHSNYYICIRENIVTITIYYRQRFSYGS
jgi:hypothetical protein